jgi:DNA (cytosine-5)-methyltransferase 1
MMHMSDWTSADVAAPLIGHAAPELPQRPRLIDLFGGAGGMTAGFSPLFGHSFNPVWANDMNRDAAATYNVNFGDHCVVDDIVSLLLDPRIVPEADVVIGGPPCQGFSLLNKGRRIDPRKQLWYPFMEVVQRSGASVFVIENVPQLLRSIEHEQIMEYAQAIGFTVCSAKLCAADYGVPQVRWRAFIVGCNFADPGSVFPPRRTHFKPRTADRLARTEDTNLYVSNPSPWQTVWDAIGDLPEPLGTQIGVEPPLDLHFGRKPTDKSMVRYRAVPDQGMNRFDLQQRAPELTPDCWVRKTSGGTDLFGRLWWDRPAFTIRTEFFKPEKGRYLHPTQHRPITHREAARLQSFPDAFRFHGSKSEIARQIGNAVPPLLAARIADSVMALVTVQGDGHRSEPVPWAVGEPKPAGICAQPAYQAEDDAGGTPSLYD